MEVGGGYSSSFAFVAFLSGIVSWITPFSYHIWRETISKKRKVTNFWQRDFLFNKLGVLNDPTYLVRFFNQLRERDICTSRQGHQLLHGGAGWLPERRGWGSWLCFAVVFFGGRPFLGVKKNPGSQKITFWILEFPDREQRGFRNHDQKGKWSQTEETWKFLAADLESEFLDRRFYLNFVVISGFLSYTPGSLQPPLSLTAANSGL